MEELDETGIPPVSEKNLNLVQFLLGLANVLAHLVAALWAVTFLASINMVPIDYDHLESGFWLGMAHLPPVFHFTMLVISEALAVALWKGLKLIDQLFRKLRYREVKGDPFVKPPPVSA